MTWDEQEEVVRRNEYEAAQLKKIILKQAQMKQ